MATVARALKRAYDGVLGEGLEIGDGEGEVFFHQSIDGDAVSGGVKVWDGTMVSIISSAILGDEAA